MRIVATQAALNAALSIVKGAVTKGAGLPITEYALFRPSEDGNFIEVIAADSGATVTTRFEAQITDPSPICVPRDRLSNLISLLKGEIIIETLQEKGWARLECGRTKQRLPLKAAEDFPVPEALDNTATRRIPAALLYSALKATDLAAAKSEEGTTFTLTCVHMTVGDEKMKLESCDTKQLAFADCALTQPSLPTEQQDMDVMLPTTSLASIEKAVSGIKDGSDVLFTLAPNFVEIETATQTLRVRTGVGTYPPLHTVLTKQGIGEQPYSLELDPTELIMAIRRASLAVEKGENKSRAVWLRFTATKLFVEVRDRGSEAQEILDISCPSLNYTEEEIATREADTSTAKSVVDESAQMSFDEMADDGSQAEEWPSKEIRIGLLAEKLQKALELLEGMKVTFGFTDARKAISIRPIGNDLPFEYLYITLPVRQIETEEKATT